MLHITPRNPVEFRNFATRPIGVNGLELPASAADGLAATFEAAFSLLNETQDIYPAWKALVGALGVLGKQVHDARLMAVCHVYGVSHLLTFNVAHFTRLAGFGPGGRGRSRRRRITGRRRRNTRSRWPCPTAAGIMAGEGGAAMNQTVEGVYDGAVFRPDAALALEPNTRVRLTVEILPPAEAAPPSFLRTARSLELHGPADWSANLDSYLYGDGDQHNSM